MLDISRIGVRCSRIADSLDVKMTDGVALLRAARVLKNVHADLKLLLWHQSKRTGWTEAIARTQLALELTERDLRQVLLEYETMAALDVSTYLRRACELFLQTIDVLEQASLPSMILAGESGQHSHGTAWAIGAE